MKPAINLPAPLRELVAEICARYLIAVDQVLSRDRRAATALARHHIWHELRERGWSYPQIGELFRRDHSTVMQGVSSFELIAGLTTDNAKAYAVKRDVRKAAYAERGREVA